MLNIIIDVLGVVGFLFSVVNFIYFFVIRMKKLRFVFSTYGIRDYFDSSDIVMVRLQIDNLSQLPISITRIQLLRNEKSFDSYHYRQKAAEFKTVAGDRIISEDSTYTTVLPINLSPLGAYSGFLAFVVPRDTLPRHEKSLTFRICTNRGRAIQKTFELHEEYLSH